MAKGEGGGKRGAMESQGEKERLRGRYESIGSDKEEQQY